MKGEWKTINHLIKKRGLLREKPWGIKSEKLSDGGKIIIRMPEKATSYHTTNHLPKNYNPHNSVYRI